MEKRDKTRVRAEIDDVYKWQLDAIFPTDAAWEEAFAQAKDGIAAIEALQKGLAPQKESILHALQAIYALERTVDKLYTYARMRRDEDSREPVPQAMADRIMSFVARASAVTAFLKPALLAMPEALLLDCAKDSNFSEYDRFLADILRRRPHVLPAEQEALLAEAAEIGNAPENIYTLFTEADLKFPDIRDEHGAVIELTEARLLTLLNNRDGRVRKDAYETIMRTYGEFGNAMASIYAASVKNDSFRARAHKFASAMEGSLFENEIPPSVYGALLQAIDEKLPALNRYLSCKKQTLGLSELHMWDLYVDTTSEFSLQLPYDEAYALVLDALAPLGESYVEIVRQAKTSGWIDVYPNVGKHNGAYSWGCYDAKPYVLLNFEDTLDSASTLAHELGHSMHSYLSAKAQPYAKADYTLFAAEVASTVNEILLSAHLLEKYTTREARQSLLGTLLEGFRTTVFRQALFATFERDTHAMHERGEALTKEALCDLYSAINQRFYGESCVLDEAVRFEWMRIPHFYRAFYVYQYATGFCAAACIARKILAEGKPAVDGYMKFLSAGGSMPPLEALRLAGVDMETPAPVREALDWFEEMIARFEEVC